MSRMISSITEKMYRGWHVTLYDDFSLEGRRILDSERSSEHADSGVDLHSPENVMLPSPADDHVQGLPSSVSSCSAVLGILATVAMG